MIVLIKVCFACFISSIGFGVIFNVKVKHLFCAGIIGALSGLTYQITYYCFCNEPIAYLFASIILSLCSEFFSKIYKCPALIFTACSLIPFVPGKYLYQMTAMLLIQNVNMFNLYFMKTLNTAISLVFGILITLTLIKTIKSHKK